MNVPLPTTPYFDPQMPISFWSDKLPHWEQTGKISFLTFRLGDSMPQSVMRQYEDMKKQFIKCHPYPWDTEIYRQYEELIANPLERFVDVGYGECVLKDPAVRRYLSEAIEYYDHNAILVWASVIMPNHVHMLVSAAPGISLSGTISSIKRFSATRINRYLGRKGRLWQDEPFDTLVRSDRQYKKFVEYIRNNPNGLPAGTYEFGGLEFSEY